LELELPLLGVHLSWLGLEFSHIHLLLSLAVPLDSCILQAGSLFWTEVHLTVLTVLIHLTVLTVLIHLIVWIVLMILLDSLVLIFNLLFGGIIKDFIFVFFKIVGLVYFLEYQLILALNFLNFFLQVEQFLIEGHDGFLD
jgi:hypothetical protein